MDPKSDKIKVLYYNHTGDVSGAEISLLLTISHMPDSVDTVLVAPEGELLERARKQGINVIPVTSHRARMSKNVITIIRGVVGTLTAGLRLRKMLRHLQPQIVHANSIRAGLIAVIAVMGLKITLIWHVRDILPTNLVGRLIRWVAAWRVHAVIAISKAIHENFASITKLRGKARVVYNGIDISFTGKSIRPEFGVPDDRFVVAVVGQIASWKRQLDAIEAFSQFIVEHPESELWIVGEPRFRPENMRYEADLRERVRVLGLQGRIRFLGFRPDVMNVMSSIDVLLVPSDNEPFGRVIIEAMAVGKIVVGTNSGGIPEIVAHNHTGYIHDVGDVDEINQYLRKVAMGGHQSDMVEASRQRVRKMFSIDTVVGSILIIYRSLLDQHVDVKNAL